MSSFEKRVQVCCHNVVVRYWDIDQPLNDELKEVLIEEGERRSKECICDGCCSGELNCLYNDEEIRGWFKIEED